LFKKNTELFWLFANDPIFHLLQGRAYTQQNVQAEVRTKYIWRWYVRWWVEAEFSYEVTKTFVSHCIAGTEQWLVCITSVSFPIVKIKYNIKMTVLSWDGLDYTVTRLRAGTVRGSNPGSSKRFFSLQIVQTGCGVHLVSGYRSFLNWSKLTEAWSLLLTSIQSQS
jgi:hypothetical protein